MIDDDGIVSSGGFCAPVWPQPFAGIELDISRFERNAAALRAAMLAGETVYPEEDIFGIKRLVPVPVPPTRRVRLGRRLREARRRLHAAVYVLRRGDTGDDYYDVDD